MEKVFEKRFIGGAQSIKGSCMLIVQEKKSFIFFIINIPRIIRDAWAPAGIIGVIALFIHNSFSFTNYFLIIGIVLGYALAYGLNDYFDAETDKNDPEKFTRNFFVTNSISRKVSSFVVLSVISILVAIFFNFGLRGLIFLFVSLLIMVIYSAEPFKIKSKPPFDLIIHSLFVLAYPYFLVVFLIPSSWKQIDIFILSIFFLGSLIIQLENQVRDYDSDIKTSNNSTILIGKINSLRLIKILTGALTLITITGFMLFPIVILIPYAIIYSPIVLYRIIGNTGKARPDRLVRIVIAASLVYTVILILYVVSPGDTFAI